MGAGTADVRIESSEECIHPWSDGELGGILVSEQDQGFLKIVKVTLNKWE